MEHIVADISIAQFGPRDVANLDGKAHQDGQLWAHLRPPQAASQPENVLAMDRARSVSMPSFAITPASAITSVQ